MVRGVILNPMQTEKVNIIFSIFIYSYLSEYFMCFEILRVITIFECRLRKKKQPKHSCNWCESDEKTGRFSVIYRWKSCQSNKVQCLNDIISPAPKLLYICRYKIPYCKHHLESKKKKTFVMSLISHTKGKFRKKLDNINYVSDFSF